jgi:Lipocalin-like domain
MPKVLAALTVCVVISAALTIGRYSGTVEAQEPTDVRSRFLGTWKLLSTEEKLKDGTMRPYKDFGPHGLGYLMYATDGHMCAELMNPDRPNWDRPATAAQKISAIDGLAAYCGTFKIDEVNHVMLHYPEVAWKPSYLGTEQRRPYRFEDNRLIFSDKAGPDDEPDVERWTIMWEKVK